MLPIALLLNEHGIIGLMIDSMKERVQTTIRQHQQPPTSEFINIAVDFFKIYTDRLHHGKEETILFRALATKKLAPEHRKIMDELINEHIYARETVNALGEAQKKYDHGELDAIKEIQATLKRLIEFYPKHIEKENMRFFYPSMGYFSPKELDDMAEEFLRFDANIIHIKYIDTVERLIHH